MVEIRPLNTDDLSQYKELMLEAFETFPDAFTSTTDERAALPDEQWLARIDNSLGNALCIGAFKNKELTATVSLEFNCKTKTSHKAKLIGMYVRPTAQQRGIGKKLLEFTLKQARARNELSVITLTVTTGNNTAIKLYRSFGLKNFGTEPMAIHTPNGYLGKEHMWLKL